MTVYLHFKLTPVIQQRLDMLRCWDFWLLKLFPAQRKVQGVVEVDTCLLLLNSLITFAWFSLRSYLSFFSVVLGGYSNDPSSMMFSKALLLLSLPTVIPHKHIRHTYLVILCGYWKLIHTFQPITFLNSQWPYSFISDESHSKIGIYQDFCWQKRPARFSSTVNMYSFEVLIDSISILCCFILLLHYILEANIVIFTPLPALVTFILLLYYYTNLYKI